MKNSILSVWWRHFFILLAIEQCYDFLFQKRHVVYNNSPKNIRFQRIVRMNDKPKIKCPLNIYEVFYP